MSRLSRHLAIAAITVTLLAGTAGAQLIPGLSAPSLPSLPSPAGIPNVPVAGPVLQDVLAQPQAQQAIAPTLDSIGGLPESIADSGAPTLLQLRNLRLRNLIRENRQLLESDDKGEPVRRGILVAVDPDPVSLRLAAAAGFRVIGSDSEPQLDLSSVDLAVPNGRPRARRSGFFARSRRP